MSTDTVEQIPQTDDAKTLATGRLFQALASDPKYRKEVLGLIKKAAPETPIPELDFEHNVIKSVDERVKPYDEQFKKITESIDSLNRNLSRERWKESEGLTEEDAVAVEEVAKTGKIGDAKTAVEYWRNKQLLGNPRGTRKTPPGAQEYLSKIQKINPRNSRALQEAASAEAVRILSTSKRAS